MKVKILKKMTLNERIDYLQPDIYRIFNDFTNPLYFYPGAENATVVLTLYNFIGQFQSSYNLLFADVVIIIIPMLILFIIFNKKIVNGMVAGAVKG